MQWNSPPFYTCNSLLSKAQWSLVLGITCMMLAARGCKQGWSERTAQVGAEQRTWGRVMSMAGLLASEGAHARAVEEETRDHQRSGTTTCWPQSPTLPTAGIVCKWQGAWRQEGEEAVSRGESNCSSLSVCLFACFYFSVAESIIKSLLANTLSKIPWSKTYFIASNRLYTSQCLWLFSKHLVQFLKLDLLKSDESAFYKVIYMQGRIGAFKSL